MAGGKRRATSIAGGSRPAKQRRRATTNSIVTAPQTPVPIPLSSPLKPLPKPNLRDLLTEPATSTFKPVPSQGFPRRISTDLPQDSLLDIFRLFCPIHMLDQWHAWKPTNAAEIYLFFGVLIYMSIHLEPRFEHYWSTAPTNPVHPIARFMSRNRFQLLYRRFCVWDTTDPPQGVFNKINNWSTHLQETSTRYWNPASEAGM
ncbi:transposase IS4 domain-containing protein [Pochonia chlamydosporia 170]|uniref:Transposase IS4 domain-containing protein n=1 Tax=Pochonia chlamydosporia 170 TaxID=1380566 RepID=A0A219AS73_METCM|nr:transposase IS4 domain-containing protein [Pochonia chlamydosporia 170]OWT43618.1 transposase IS4 domain-containing protein [Pochonia chlamydosporia 170]